MSKLIEVLFAYGMDKKATLERFVNDETLYESCFWDFLVDPELELLSTSMAEGNYEAAFEHAHTMKGVSGNLGLTPLYQAICALVEVLRRKQYETVDSAYQVFAEELERLRDTVSEISAGEE